MTCTTSNTAMNALTPLLAVRQPAPVEIADAGAPQFLGLGTRFIAAARQYIASRSRDDVFAYMDWFNRLTWGRTTTAPGRPISYGHVQDVAVRMDLSSGMLYLSWDEDGVRRRAEAASWVQVHAFILARHWA